MVVPTLAPHALQTPSLARNPSEKGSTFQERARTVPAPALSSPKGLLPPALPNLSAGLPGLPGLSSVRVWGVGAASRVATTADAAAPHMARCCSIRCTPPGTGSPHRRHTTTPFDTANANSRREPEVGAVVPARRPSVVAPAATPTGPDATRPFTPALCSPPSASAGPDEAMPTADMPHHSPRSERAGQLASRGVGRATNMRQDAAREHCS